MSKKNDIIKPKGYLALESVHNFNVYFITVLYV